MRSIFGWDLPPGAASDPRAPWNEKDGPCDVCGLTYDNCICPECAECGAVGDLLCYEEHGLVRSEEQKEAKEKADREAYEADQAYCRWEEEQEGLYKKYENRQEEAFDGNA